MSKNTASKATALLIGALLGTLLLSLGPLPVDLRSMRSEAQGSASSKAAPPKPASSEKNNKEKQKRTSSIVIFDKLIEENESEKTPRRPPKKNRKEEPESSSTQQESDPKPSSEGGGKATLASNGKGTTGFSQVRDVLGPDNIDPYNVWLIKGKRKIVGQFLSESVFIERSDDYFEAKFAVGGRRLKATMSSTMREAARRTLGKLEDGITAYVVLGESDRRAVAREVRSRALEKGIPGSNGRFWEQVAEVFLDIRNNSLKVTRVKWRE